jgi:hypothetical protein
MLFYCRQSKITGYIGIRDICHFIFRDIGYLSSELLGYEILHCHFGIRNIDTPPKQGSQIPEIIRVKLSRKRRTLHLTGFAYICCFNVDKTRSHNTKNMSQFIYFSFSFVCFFCFSSVNIFKVKPYICKTC